MLFAITCIDKPDSLELRLATRAAHLAYAAVHADRMLAGGPLLAEDGTTMIGSLIIIDLPDRAAAEALMAEDPYVLAGLFDSVTIRAYKKVLP